ncbi:MAG: hypothetical protein R6U21_01805 [Thermoplasmatota archaeon]
MVDTSSLAHSNLVVYLKKSMMYLSLKTNKQFIESIKKKFLKNRLNQHKN